MNCPKCDTLTEWFESEHLYYCPKCKIFIYPNEHNDDVTIIDIKITGDETYLCPQKIGMIHDR